MAKVTRIADSKKESSDFVVRAGVDGRLERVILTQAEREARAKFLRVAALTPVSKKKKKNLTTAQAQRIVAEYFRNHAVDTIQS